jgi:hypothetical protein
MTSLSPSIRRALVAACAVLVLGGAAVGIAAAQATPTPAPGQAQAGYQKFLDALAKRLNITTANLQTAIAGARTDAGFPAGGAGFPGGKGPRGGPGPGRAGFGFGLDLKIAATAIGIPVDQLRTELRGRSLADVATAHGKTGQIVIAALEKAAHDRIDQAVTANKLTADQATTRKTQADARIEKLVSQVMPQGGPGGRPGFGGRPGPGGFGGRGFFGEDLTTAAAAIGIPADQLRTELNGKSLAQVATAHGKTADALTTALKNAAYQRIDQAVTAGKLTADQATQLKTRTDQRIKDEIERVTPQRGA